jgi:hypothetical protein
MASILHILIQNPHIISSCPKFTDKRQFRSSQINGIGDFHNPISPLAELFRDIIPILLSSAELFVERPALPVDLPQTDMIVAIPTLKLHSAIW